MLHNVDELYKPISMWGYFGYQILFGLPVIGFIALLVCAFGNRNYNVRNFARSYFCVLIIVLVLIVLLAALGVGGTILAAIAEKLATVGG